MASIAEKVAHVGAAPDDGLHTCHWPGCTRRVKPAHWGCLPHWRRLPIFLRTKVWNAYQPGQEVNKTPSAEYVAVMGEVRDWIEKNAVPLFAKR